MGQVIWWIVIVLAGSGVMAAQTLDKLKTRWRAGDYANTLKPLIDMHYAVAPQSRAAQEVDYMIARAMCSMHDYVFEGCLYCKTLSTLYRGSLLFEGKPWNTVDLERNCCPWEDAHSRGIMTAHTADDILKSVARKLAPGAAPNVVVKAPASLETTTLNVERSEATLPGDWITGYRLVSVDRAGEEFWHWMVRLEVEYVYSVGHGSVALTGVAKGGPMVSGFSYWGGLDDAPYGPQYRKAVQRLQIAVHLDQPESAANVVHLTLQETAPPYRTIIAEDFPFSRVFRLP